MEDAPVDNATKVQQVIEWILTGQSEHAIREAIFANWPDEKDTPLILTAMSTIKESSQMSHEDVQAFCFAATKDLYRRQVANLEFAGAMRALRQMEEISGRMTKQEPAPRKVAHLHVHTLGPVTAENLEQYRRQLLERADRIGHVTG